MISPSSASVTSHPGMAGPTVPGVDAHLLQLVMVFPFFFALVALYDLGTRPTLGAGARLGIWTGVAFLTSEYYGLFLLVVVAIGVTIVLGRRLGDRVVLGSLLTALGCAAFLSGPLLIPQAHLTARYRWTTETVTENSAGVADYGEPRRRRARCVVRAVVAQRHRRAPLARYRTRGARRASDSRLAWAAGRRRWAVFFGGGAVVAGVLSLGLHLEIGGFAPYSVLRDHLPGFSRLRSPFRFAVVVQVLMVGLAGFALGRLWSWRGRTGQIVAVVVVVVAVAEGVFLPASLARPLPDFASPVGCGSCGRTREVRSRWCRSPRRTRSKTTNRRPRRCSRPASTATRS